MGLGRVEGRGLLSVGLREWVEIGLNWVQVA